MSDSQQFHDQAQEDDRQDQHHYDDGHQEEHHQDDGHMQQQMYQQ